MAKQLDVDEYDLMNVEKFNAYTRLLIDNTATDAFNMHCFPLPEGGNPQVAEQLKKMSRAKYGKDRIWVEKNILERSKIGQLGKEEKPGLRDRLAKK